MVIRGRHAIWLAGIGLALLASCLAEEPPGPVVPLDLASGGVGLWMIHIQGGRFTDNIEVVQVIQTPSLRRPFQLTVLPTLSWAGQQTNDLDLRDAFLDRRGLEWVWTLVSGTGDTERMRYEILGDTLRGKFEANDSGGRSLAYDLFGVRVPEAAWHARSLMPAADDLGGGTPIVLIELDDDPAQDRDFLRRLFSRSLRAMIAVPTEFAGREGRPSWDELRVWANRGFGMAAHSRWHSSLTQDGAGFASEVIGSLGTMNEQGLPTAVFVQPGNWPEVIQFDSLSKFRTWRGSLLRTFTRAFEGGFRAGSVPEPVTDSMAYGFNHWTISDGLGRAGILHLWQEAQQPNRFSIFLVHTWRLPNPSTLDWFLDTLAAAQSAKRIRIAGSVADVLR